MKKIRLNIWFWHLHPCRCSGHRTILAGTFNKLTAFSDTSLFFILWFLLVFSLPSCIHNRKRLLWLFRIYSFSFRGLLFYFWRICSPFLLTCWNLWLLENICLFFLTLFRLFSIFSSSNFLVLFSIFCYFRHIFVFPFQHFRLIFLKIMLKWAFHDLRTWHFWIF